MDQKGIQAQSFMQKHQRYVMPAIAIVALIVLIIIALMVRNRLSSTSSQAGCYGYGCLPSVKIGARVAGYGYSALPLTYGTLKVKRGQSIELGWTSQNVDSCSAAEKWTLFNGPYYPPTLFPQKIGQTRSFSVICTKNNRKAASSTVNVVVSVIGR